MELDIFVMNIGLKKWRKRRSAKKSNMVQFGLFKLGSVEIQFNSHVEIGVLTHRKKLVPHNKVQNTQTETLSRLKD